MNGLQKWNMAMRNSSSLYKAKSLELCIRSEMIGVSSNLTSGLEF